jgi:O-antigen ligase
MSGLALGRTSFLAGFWLPAVVTACLTSCILFIGPTLNQSLALVFAAAIFTLWFYDKASATTLGIASFLVKPFFVRLAYAIDTHQGGAPGFDLLGITPALVLSSLIVIQLWLDFAAGRRLCPDRTRLFLWLFVLASFLSIFNPANSLLVGLGGFERNILPNMMILFLTAAVFSQPESAIRFVKVLLIVGLVSCIYAIGQYTLGIYSWEQSWLDRVVFSRSVSGWFTVGLRGIELRIFSVFYGYMDFFFSNALIFGLTLACKEWLSAGWRRVRIVYFISWALILALSLERMPIVMCIASAISLYYLASSPRRRKVVAWASLTSVGIALAVLQIAGPALKTTGAATLVRLAELSNPLSASSIQDRMDTKWGPALETIRANPLGVGIGYGSQTKANEIAMETDLYVQPHNELIQKILETGIPGCVLYVALLAAIFAPANRFRRSSHLLHMLGAGFVALSVAFWLCGLVNVPFSGSPGILYWSVAGIVLSLERKHREAD